MQVFTRLLGVRTQNSLWSRFCWVASWQSKMHNNALMCEFIFLIKTEERQNALLLF